MINLSPVQNARFTKVAQKESVILVNCSVQWLILITVSTLAIISQ